MRAARKAGQADLGGAGLAAKCARDRGALVDDPRCCLRRGPWLMISRWLEAVSAASGPLARFKSSLARMR